MQKFISKICILADTHNLFDDRIYWKEALSLKKAGYTVVFILAAETEESGQTAEGIAYHKIKRDVYPGNRLLNYVAKRYSPKGLYSQMYSLAAIEKATVYHYHDLRINRIASRLKKLPHRPKLIYDVHEPYPENINDYHGGGLIMRVFKKLYSLYIRWWERKKAGKCDLIITTEENLQQRFKNDFPDKPVEVIYNYTNLPGEQQTETTKKYDAIYTGGITRCRGAMKILEAVKLARERHPALRVLFLGSWFPQSLKHTMLSYIHENNLTENVELHDAVPYCEVENYYRQSKIGLGIFLPIPTHRIILQIKIFEYMNFGLPIIGSNFGHIHSMVQKHQCGISVDPENPGEIADALIQMVSDGEMYRAMSDRAKKAVQENYRWERMEDKLIDIYRKLSETDKNDK